jgi:Cu(I)/Ag(I) efflux system membrane fusion protein
MIDRRNLQVAAYWLIFGILGVALGACNRAADNDKGAAAEVDFWTCAMHPSVRAKAPGKCPICGMNLVAVVSSKSERLSQLSGSEHRGAGTESAALVDSGESSRENRGAKAGELKQFDVPRERLQQMGVAYAEARLRPAEIDVRSFGNLELDQRQIFECAAHVDGYVDDIKVASPGIAVEAGQPLMTISSSDLRTPQQEYINLIKVRVNGVAGAAAVDQLIDLARRRLRLLDMSPQEISELEQTLRTTDQVLVRAPAQGIVSEAPMTVGQGVKPGDRLMRIVTLSHLWLWANFYEDDSALLKENQPVTIFLTAFPGRVFSGTIAAISPTIDPLTRTSKVRIDIPNSDNELKPGMRADVIVEIGMGDQLTVPVNAVLPTGSRMLVFVDKEAGKLEPRFIQVGRQCRASGSSHIERYYQVTAGLKPGERVVASANFLIDAEAQIQGALQNFSEEKASLSPESVQSEKTDGM